MRITIHHQPTRTQKVIALAITLPVLFFVPIQEQIEYQRDYRLTQKVNQRLGADPSSKAMPGVARGKMVASLCASAKFMGSSLTKEEILEDLNFSDRRQADPRFAQIYDSNKSLFEAVSVVAIEECGPNL
jgi:hypothetical protein